MTGEHIKPNGEARHMAISLAKVLLVLALLAQVSRAAGGLSGCCARRPRACGLYGLRCNSTAAAPVRLNSDASAGILTLGRRRTAESRYQDRLQHLLQGARNQAAGILTMGKRLEAGEARAQALKLELGKPARYLHLQTETRDSYTP